MSRTWTSPDVYCKHCGEISHPTYDCPLKDQPVNKQVIDEEYHSFMNEIMNEDQSKTEDEKKYEKFMEEVNQPQFQGYPPNMGMMPPPPWGDPYQGYMQQ